MFTSIADFEKIWQDESESTLKLLNQLTDQSLTQKVTDDHRNLGRMAWHVMTSITEMMPLTGLKVEGPDPKAPVPATAEEIRSGYEKAAASMLKQIKAGWRKRGYTLFVLVAHQTHHLGQMTVLMRQAGLKVPGIYGPSKEEWSAYNMQEPEV
jgi:uncharacterized damage-inducible protein DinB